ncbi:MAG TPA: hypothetical protein VMU78_02085 [Methylocella sp.]|nr:hypothetical protein [Methylocella sp.]
MISPRSDAERRERNAALDAEFDRVAKERAGLLAAIRADRRAAQVYQRAVDFYRLRVPAFEYVLALPALSFAASTEKLAPNLAFVKAFAR